MAPFRGVGDGRDDMRQALYRLFQPSRIEIRDPAREGTVTRQGRLLVLAGDRVPAKPFRVIEVGKVRQHVMDFARIDVSEDGEIRTEPAPFTVARGTPMVVLDVQLTGDDVRLLTHTASPLGVHDDGDVVYGCTEFVFHFKPATLAGGSVKPIIGVIEQWLGGALVNRTCRAGVSEICLEP